MNLEIHKNFLDKDFFLNFKKIIIDQDFPWRFREKMTEKNNNFFFTYSFFNQSSDNFVFLENRLHHLLHTGTSLVNTIRTLK